MLGTLRFAQPTMLRNKDLALMGSNNEVAVHVDSSVVLSDRVNPVGWAKRSVPNNLQSYPCSTIHYS